MLRVGVVGLGVGKGHVRGYAAHPGAQAVAVADTNAALLATVADEHAIPGRYESYREMLDAERLDVVSVALPNYLHKPVTIAALESGAHVPEHYWEAIDAYLRAITKRYVLGYRLEFWPRTEKQVERMMTAAGLSNVRTGRAIWRNDFTSGGDAFDFFAAISASFWYAKFPAERRRKDYETVREYFVRKHRTQVTDDIVLGYGGKPVRGR